jgi:hypothetical protein
MRILLYVHRRGRPFPGRRITQCRLVRIRGAQKDYSLVVPPLSKANIAPAGPPVAIEQN